MRILLLNWKDLKNPESGGAEVYVHELANHWSSWRHPTTLFVRSFPGATAEDLVEGVPVVRRGNRYTVYREARRYFAERQGEFDIIFESVNTRPFMAHRFTPSKPSIALFHQTAQEIWNFEMPLPLALFGRYVLEPRWLKAYRNVPSLANSPSTEEDLRSHGLRHVRQVPIGATVPMFDSLPAKQPHPTFIFVGRLSENKRPDHAIAAFDLIRKSLPEAVLWIVGEGPMRLKLEAIAPSGTVFHGRVPEAKKFELLAKSHALLATSVREGWGLMVTEAAAAGTLPIGYDIPGLRDSLALAGGVIVPPGIEALSAAAVDAVATGKAIRFQRVAPPRWEDTARACLEEMEEVIGHFPRR